MDRLLQATARAEARHFWFRGLRWFAAPLVRRATAGASRARILDCGCGTGANLEWLGRYGSAAGFDLSATGLAIARELGRTRVARGSVAAAPFASGSFDLATSFDVLYSLDSTDEQAAIAEMYRLTRPGGFILVNVAAIPALRGDHSVLSHERRRYTRASLRALLASGGFTIVRLTYTNQSLFLPMFLVRSIHRLRGLSAEADAEQEISVPPAPINALLSGLLYLESLWLRRFDNLVGSSLLCLARKPDRPGTGIPGAPGAADRESAAIGARPARTPDPTRS